MLGFREVPVDNASLSKAADIAATEPHHVQVFIGAGRDAATNAEFERRLFTLRKVISNRIYDAFEGAETGFYPVSLSTETIVYKGMFLCLSGRGLFQGPRRSALRIGCRPRPPAVLDQHFPIVEAGAPLPHDHPSTTAKSTPSAATSTGWRRARLQWPRQSSATTSPRSGRSHMRASPIPHALTTRSNFSCAAAIRCPMPP